MVTTIERPVPAGATAGSTGQNAIASDGASENIFRRFGIRQVENAGGGELPASTAPPEPPAPSDDDGRPVVEIPPELGEGMLLYDLATAFCRRVIVRYDQLQSVVEQIEACYQHSTKGAFWFPPMIFRSKDDLGVEVLPQTSPEPYGPFRTCRGYSFSTLDAVRRWPEYLQWLKQAGIKTLPDVLPEPFRQFQATTTLVYNGILRFPSPAEADYVRERYVQTAKDVLAMFSPEVLAFWTTGHSLNDDRNLCNRLADPRSLVAEAKTRAELQEAIRRHLEIFREAHSQRGDPKTLVWFGDGSLDNSDSAYARDWSRREDEAEALWAQHVERIRELDAAEENAMRESIDEMKAERHQEKDEQAEPREAGQPDDPAADSVREVGEQIQKAVEPILAGVDGAERLDAVRTLANCLRNAVDGERASLRQWQPFPLDALPRRVADFIRLAAESHSVDVSFVALPVLAVAGAALGNAFRLKLKDDFEVPPVVWCILVALTGSNKSGPLALATGPMWQAPPMPAAADSLLAGSQEQFVIDDATSEAVISRLGECHRGLLLAADELAGWLKSFDAYRKGSGGDEQKWIRFWNAKRYRVDRKTAGERTMVQAAAVSIAGAIQPELLGKAVDPEKLASGFFARALVAKPPERKRRWSRVGVGQEHVAFWQGLVDRLRTMPFAAIDPNTGQYCPNIVKLSPEAMVTWERWYGEVADRQFGSAGAERAITAKADMQAARLALILFGIACASGECDWRSPMPESIMAAGVRLAAWFLDETIRVFEATCGSAQDKRRTSLLDHVARLGDKVSARDLQRSNSRAYPTAEAARDALQDLANAGHGVFDDKVFVARRHGKSPP